MAALLQALYFSGSRLSTGEPNDTGTVWAYVIGTLTPAVLYADEDATISITQPITLDSGGRIPYATYPDGVWITSPVRLVVQDVDGATVSDAPVWPADARDTALDNAGFTGSTVDAALTALYSSVGGTDAKYLESGGATARTIKAKFAEIQISVKDFGAVGDGTSIDTTSIQNAINRVQALGGGVVWFPPTEDYYKIDQALTLSSGTGVSFKGAGVSASKIITTNTSANVFTLSSCTSTIFEGLGISASATNSASAISLSACSAVTFRQVNVDTTGGGTFLIPISASSNSARIRLEDCRLTANAADAAARALKLSSVSGGLVTGGNYDGKAGAGMEFAGTTSFISVMGVGFGNTSNNIGILWTAAMTGTDFTVMGCPTLRSSLTTVTTPFDLSALSTNPRFRQWGNEVDGYGTTVASGGTFTPDLSRGHHIRVRATTTGVAYTVALPTPAPSSVMYDYRLILDFFNNAGGAVTGWTLNAGYHMSAVSTTDLEHTVYELVWDADATVWRQVSRSVST